MLFVSTKEIDMHPILKKKPIARFYYQGSHTHPVRRTVLLIQATPKYIRGYELRDGSVVRDFKDAPIKTYRRERIAPATPYERRKDVDSRSRRGPVTYRRATLLDLITDGA